MRAAIFAISVTMTMTAAVSVRAQERLPEIVIGAPPAAPAPTGAPHQSGGSAPVGGSAAPGAPAASGRAHQNCADVPPGGQRSLGCLNEKLKQQVDKVNPVQNIPPLDAKSSDTKIGVVNIPGVQQQYGKNFGVSAVPYRPAAPVYSSPIGHR
jgi:hypothetical protein